MMLRWLWLGFVILLLNAGWLTAFPAPTVFYVGNALLHIALGAALLAGLWFGRAPLLRELRGGAKPTFLVLSVSGVLGLLLAVIGARTPNYPIVVAHAAAGALGAAMLWLWLRRKGFEVPRGAARGVGAALAIGLLLPAGDRLRDRYAPVPDEVVRNPAWAPASMDGEGGGPEGPFFPSSANTTTGELIPSNFFMESETCQECHQEIYAQWDSSAHHFSSFNNQFYRKSIEHMQEVAGVRQSKWCAGCHDHAMFFNGRFEKPVIEQIDTPQAHAGLGCMSCHAIVEVADSMGNGGFTIEYPPLHELATSDNAVIRTLTKYVTNVAPAAHKRQFLKPFLREAEYCSSCHKVHLDQPVNDYRWIRGFNEYDSWQASGVSGYGARSFYYPAASQACSDCHMPPAPATLDKSAKNGQVRSHRFPAANTALPFVNHDAEQLRVVEDFLKDGIVSVDIFAMAPLEGQPDRQQPGGKRPPEAPQMSTTFATGEESGALNAPVTLREAGRLAAPLDKAPPALSPGDRVRVDVVVRTRKVGHFFPGGTVDSVDCWVELKALDANGEPIYWSGRVADDGRGAVEPGAHFYRNMMLDEHGNHVDKRNAFQTRSLLYARLIPPGAADVARFDVRLPRDVAGPVRFEAKVNYRKFSYQYTRYAYAGRPVPEDRDESLYSAGFDDRRYGYEPENIPENVSGKIKGEIPALPITVLAEASAEVSVGGGEAHWRLESGPDDYLRWNDYGIGLLLQGDLRGAERAFERVTEARPDWADGWINRVRTLVAEGRTAEARPLSEKALELGPDLARGQYFHALILKSAGEYDAALASLRKANASYPRDRVVLNEMARVLFLQKEYAQAVERLDQVAAIDPEDLQMQYTRMLCYRGLGRADLAAQAEALFRRFKADESSQTRTARIRQTSPQDNNERQAIHEHASVPLSRNGLETADND
ncbi:MAG: tetratricopeptide repeat protein [Acidobacteria bacterium]|nr:tetratricopeptide repeat protein [Acidobacteriota bacterium]